VVSLVLQLVHEVLKLVQECVNTGDLIVDTLSWLTLNAIKSERLQNVQLSLQNVSAVWRKHAFHRLLRGGASAYGDAVPQSPSASPPSGDAAATSASASVSESGPGSVSAGVVSPPLRRGQSLPGAPAALLDVFREPLERDARPTVDPAEGLWSRTVKQAQRVSASLLLHADERDDLRCRMDELSAVLNGGGSTSTSASAPTSAAGAGDGVGCADAEAGANLDVTMQREVVDDEDAALAYMSSLLDTRMERARVSEEDDGEVDAVALGVDTTMVQTRERESEQERQKEKESEEEASKQTESTPAAAVQPWPLAVVAAASLEEHAQHVAALRELRLRAETPPLPFPPNLFVTCNHTPRDWPEAFTRVLKSVVYTCHRRAGAGGSGAVGDAGCWRLLVSLAEAESLRRALHVRHPAVVLADGTAVVSLELLSSAPCADVAEDGAPAASVCMSAAATATLAPPSPCASSLCATALQCGRFFNCELLYSPQHVVDVLRAVVACQPEHRTAFFNAALACRQREPVSWQGTALEQVRRVAGCRASSSLWRWSHVECIACALPSVVTCCLSLTTCCCALRCVQIMSRTSIAEYEGLVTLFQRLHSHLLTKFSTVRGAFVAFDSDQDGRLSSSELADMLHDAASAVSPAEGGRADGTAAVSPAQVTSVMNAIGGAGSRSVSFALFSAFLFSIVPAAPASSSVSAGVSDVDVVGAVTARVRPPPLLPRRDVIDSADAAALSTDAAVAASPSPLPLWHGSPSLRSLPAPPPPSLLSIGSSAPKQSTPMPAQPASASASAGIAAAVDAAAAASPVPPPATTSAEGAALGGGVGAGSNATLAAAVVTSSRSFESVFRRVHRPMLGCLHPLTACRTAVRVATTPRGVQVSAASAFSRVCVVPCGVAVSAGVCCFQATLPVVSGASDACVGWVDAACPSGYTGALLCLLLNCQPRFVSRLVLRRAAACAACITVAARAHVVMAVCLRCIVLSCRHLTAVLHALQATFYPTLTPVWMHGWCGWFLRREATLPRSATVDGDSCVSP
jgi:hypothetical protein